MAVTMQKNLEPLHHSMEKIHGLLLASNMPDEIICCYDEQMHGTMKLLFVYMDTEFDSKIGYAWQTYCDIYNHNPQFKYLQGIIIKKLNILHTFELSMYPSGYDIYKNYKDEIVQQINKLQLKLLSHNV